MRIKGGLSCYALYVCTCGRAPRIPLRLLLLDHRHIHTAVERCRRCVPERLHRPRRDLTLQRGCQLVLPLLERELGLLQGTGRN